MRDEDFTKMCRQSSFCNTLMNRLNNDIYSSKVSCGSVENHTVMQNDIVRLRRELLALSKMLDPWSDTK